MTELSLDKCICADVGVKGKWYRTHHMKIKLNTFHQILSTGSQKSEGKPTLSKANRQTNKRKINNM